MKPISTARKQLRQAINFSRSANGVRYLLAIWPDTWDWMERMNTHFHGLPMLTPGVDRVFDLEIYNVLYDIGHLGTALSNGTLRAAVKDRMLASLVACAHTTVTTMSGGNQDEAWDWSTIPFATYSPDNNAIHMETREPDITGLKHLAWHIFGADAKLLDTKIQRLLDSGGANG
ncbi:hypothetical protein GGI1_08094 [Acidithiobacillus sp. GGI-221]|nr:hypothetical protein GGI1_08094 [Acidithiobacillus sp. GGI-221]